MHHEECTPFRYYTPESPGVCYIRLAKDERDQLEHDRHGEFRCDFTLESAESQTLAMSYLTTGDVSGLHPVTQGIIAYDESRLLDRETILEMRAGIMSAEFLGFTPKHVFMVRPELEGVEIDIVDGENVYNKLFQCSDQWMKDNPEWI